MKSNYFIFLVIVLISAACGPKLPVNIKTAMKSLPNNLDFNIHVKPILSDKCFTCHGPDLNKQKAKLRLDIAEFAFAELSDSPGKFAIDPGNLENSQVFQRIMTTDPELIMPAPESHLVLSDYEKAVLIKWIKDGAEYKKHWAFEKPVMPNIPKVKNNELVSNPIDNFVLARLEQKSLSFSKNADKEILARRVSFDLTGLPPTIPEIEEFVHDESEEAYEKLVDRLLESEHYGERMAVDWLDVGRFADSHGYTVDRLRDMSPYRDWVIKAFNDNMPYDTFVHWQLAGDLMPNPTKEMLIATAFNRNHPQNMEGGIIEEEFQAEYVMDRVNTFGQALLGLSVGCSRCHDHKYDPISQKNYYELYSFFNNVAEAGQISWNDALPSPTLLLPTKEQEKIIDFINDKIKIQEQSILDQSTKYDVAFKEWLTNGLYKNLNAEAMQKKGLIGRFTFDKNGMKNDVSLKEEAFLTRETNQKEIIEKVPGKSGNGIKMNGDSWLDCGGVGVFRKFEPFSVGMWVNLSNEMNEGVIFHKSIAERLYNFRGFHVYLRSDGTLEMTLAHTAPSNAITKSSISKVPKNVWIHLMMTYDGSSKADGVHLFLNGIELDMITEMDQLTKDIVFYPNQNTPEPGVQIGAWWRGYGSRDGIFDDIVIYDRQISAYEVGILNGTKNWNNILKKPTEDLSLEEKEALKSYYLQNVSQTAIEEENILKVLRKNKTDSLEFVQEIMVMQELPKPKKAFVLNRGNYNDLGEEVFPNTPEGILPFSDEYPKNRLGLAQWVTSEDNPLSSRVVVNRIWQNIFGVGLVKTSEDFGNQGELPSNMALLDYLAVSFQESGWDVKKLVKLMVMSTAYQQDSESSPELRIKDQANLLLARGPSTRLTSEMIRDNALLASGLMNKSIGGKSVKPYQPDGLWKINGSSYNRDVGDLVYKRSLYVIVKRTVPNPTLATFDGLTRSYCEIRRQKTNTPLQALVTLNDPTYVEACKVLGSEMARQPDVGIAIEETFRKLTGRKPDQKEKELLIEMESSELAKFRQDKSKIVGLLNIGQHNIDESLDPAKVAANTIVASVIMNSDASLTKR